MEISTVNTFAKFFSKTEMRNMAGAGGRNQENVFALVGVIKFTGIN